MKAILINWDTLYRRGGTARKGSFRPGALDLLSNLIARTPVYIYIERDDKDPRTKAWMKMKGKNIDAIKDRIIWITKPAKELVNDDATDLSEALESAPSVEMSEEDLHLYDKAPHYASHEDVIKAIKDELKLTSDDDISVVSDRNNILFKPQPTPTGSKIKKVTLAPEPEVIDSENAPLLGGKKPKSKVKRAGYGALIAGIVVLSLYAIAAIVITCVVMLAPPTAPVAIAITLALDATLKALGLGGLIASAAGALTTLTGLGAGIGALSGGKSTGKKAAELSAADDAAELKQPTTSAAVASILKSRPPKRPAPLPPTGADHPDAKPAPKDDWTIGKQGVVIIEEEKNNTQNLNSRRTSSYGT